jgi:hypothetical protein
MPSNIVIQRNSDEANALLEPYKAKDRAALDLSQQKLTALLPQNDERINQFVIIRQKELEGVRTYYSAPQLVKLNRYYQLNEISDCLSKFIELQLQIAELIKNGVSMTSPFYLSVHAVYENSVNAATALLTPKIINSDMMLALKLLTKAVVLTTNICSQPNNQELINSLSPAIVELSQESDKILCPSARDAISKTIILLAFTSLLVLPAAIVISPILLIVYCLPLAYALITLNHQSSSGKSFWNKETSSHLKPVVNSLYTFFRTNQPLPMTSLEDAASAEKSKILAV